MNKIKYLLVFLCVCCMSTAAYAQVRVSGHVYNRTDGPVMMANVTERDANNRIVENTTTDINGNFSMMVKNVKNRLEVSYVGYEKFSQVIGATRVFRVEMKNKHQLKGVVKKGQRKVMSSGLEIPAREVSVARQTLNMDDMEGLSFETADQALQGQIAGLDIVANSGNLGAGTSMRLRGVTTITGNQEPLIVVDGQILDDYAQTDVDLQDMDNTEQFAQLLSVNPEDIQTIDVLKDAAACAKWGSRAANGVIEITTRRGRRGPTRVNFSYRFSGTWQPDGIKMLSGDEYTMMLKEAYFNPKQNDVTSDIVELSYDKDRPMYYANYNKNTDWVKESSQFGMTHDYNITFSGGGDRARFRISNGYNHETGSIIKQTLDRLSTRMALDYDVSDRILFSSNFSLTYTNNKRNYSGILQKAYSAMPNMSIWRYEYDDILDRYVNTGEYYKMPPAAGSEGPVPDGKSSYYLSDMVSNGNPIAIANLAWSKVSTYRIAPMFNLTYRLLGKRDEHKAKLDYNGSVNLNSFTQTSTAYKPKELDSKLGFSGMNQTSDAESKSMSFNTRHSLTFTPYFRNSDHYFTAMIQGEIGTSSSSSQNLSANGVNSGITDPTVSAYLTAVSSGTSKSHNANGNFSAHYSYKGKYALDFTLRADGSTSYGDGKKWSFWPSISGRWNVSDEKFMKPVSKIISMLSFRPSYGLGGREPSQNDMYESYRRSGTYAGMDAITPSGLRLINIKAERTRSWNLGSNVGLFKDFFNVDFDVYVKNTTHLIMGGVKIPSASGYDQLSSANAGGLQNKGWELNVSMRRIKITHNIGFKLRFNISQNVNLIKSMDATVLASNNSEFSYTNESWMSRVQVGNALGGIYGFRFKGVYRFDYDHCGYFADESKNTVYGNKTAAYAEKYGYEGSHNATCPVARDAKGNIIFDVKGNPVQMYFNYGGTNFKFGGGDVMYEDINHDGQINELDIVYLGSSNPKLHGGFGVSLYFGRWSVNTSFNFRLGNKIVNLARMKAEDMLDNKNQSRAVRWRWRKNGDITEIPRALSQKVGESFNALASDRYVEKGDYIRFQYLQLSYDINPKYLKKFGMKRVSISMSGNNLIFWTKYSGVDPEHGGGGWSPATDSSQTPRSRSFTFSLNVGF